MKTRTWSALCLVLGGCAAPGASGEVESATRPSAAYYRDILRGLVGRECLLRSTESAILDFEAKGFTLSLVGEDFVRLEHQYEGRRREVYLPIAALDRAAAQGPRYARAGIEGRDGQHVWGLQARERSAVQRASRILASRDSLRALRPVGSLRLVVPAP